MSKKGAYTNRKMVQCLSLGIVQLPGGILRVEKQFRANKDLKRLVELDN